MRLYLGMTLMFCSALIVVAVASSILEIWATTRGAAFTNTLLAEQAPAALPILTSSLMARSSSRLQAR